MRNQDQEIQEQIGALLGSLKRVDPPADFDFRVRARIAKGRPAVASHSWLPASVKLAVPVGLTLVVGGYFGYNAIYLPESATTPTVAEVATPNPQPMTFAPVADEPVATSNPTIAAVTEVKSPETKESVKRTDVKKTSTSTKASSTDRGGGSVDIAGREGTRIFPGGVDPNANTAVKPESVPTSRITARDALQKIGVTAAFSGGRWKVESVAADSTAGRSGVKAGDTIEALNGKPLGEKAAIDGGAPAKAMRIRRDGRTMFVGLRP